MLNKYDHNDFVVIIFSLMSGKLNQEQQVQVVIRLKPLPKQQLHNRSVYVSDEQQKTLVVETPNKKEYFVFDNIADDECSQQQIYQYIGQDAVKSSTDGYNCCIFAYGQTGTGKTYSILGNSQELANDYYAESRGILPRLLSDLFSWCSNETDRFWIKCSYLEIYNEQIIDLLNPDLKLRQIREDFKKGVYVEGLSQQNATTYEQALNILLKGVKNRKTSATSMNDESSRSHTIFTLNVESQFMKDDITKIRRSKINIVDLAGSERAKQTKVEGDRLKQGCNINRSLHVLGNVINALVESAKKKKHIPFRDSKLTHFLKDSLSGNSITKLLANIHGSKAYLGDTLSTLMFAKRAKILKMKVQVNQNMTENFQQLRKQIRKLRQELAEARYIKNEQRVVDKNATESQNQMVVNIQKIDISNFDMSKHEHLLQVFQENQLNYKTLIQIYEEHMKICALSNKNRKNLNMHQEWRNLQKKNQSYRNLLKNVPAFTKIFKENIQLKAQTKQKSSQKQFSNTLKQLDSIQISVPKQKDEALVPQSTIKQIKMQYDDLLKQIQAKFVKYIEELESNYEQMEAENKSKQERIKELKKRKELPPDLEQLSNENQYLKLNILELQNQIANYEQKQRRLMVELKQLKKQKQLQNHSGLSQTNPQEQDTQIIYSKLHEIKGMLQKQIREHEQQRNQMLNYIEKLKQKLIIQMDENKTFVDNIQQLKQQNKGLKKKINSLLKINNQIQITRDQNTYTNTFWTNQQSNFSEELEIFNDKKVQDEKRSVVDKDQQSRIKIQYLPEDQKIKNVELSNQIVKLHKSYNQQILRLKQEIKYLQKSRKQLVEQNHSIVNKLKIPDSKQTSRLLEKKLKTSQAQQSGEQVSLSHTKSTTALQRVRESKMTTGDVGKKECGNEMTITVNKKNILHIREEKQEKVKKSSL